MFELRTSTRTNYRGIALKAEFYRDTGRFGIAENGIVVAEWFAIASVGSFNHAGMCPNEADLLRLLHEHRAYRTGTNDPADMH